MNYLKDFAIPRENNVYDIPNTSPTCCAKRIDHNLCEDEINRGEEDELVQGQVQVVADALTDIPVHCPSHCITTVSSQVSPFKMVMTISVGDVTHDRSSDIHDVWCNTCNMDSSDQ